MRRRQCAHSLPTGPFFATHSIINAAAIQGQGSLTNSGFAFTHPFSARMLRGKLLPAGRQVVDEREPEE